MENSPSSKPRASTSEQLRSIGFTLALISLPIIAGTCGNIFDVLKLPVAKATKPSKEPTKPTKSSESKEKQEETVLTQEAVRKILEELGYDVDDVFKTFEKSPKQERYNIVGSDDEKVIAPLRRVMMVQNAPDPEWSVSIDVQARHGPDGQQRIAVVIEESRWIKFGKFRAPTRYELAVITPGPFPLREVQMADGMWLEPRLGRSGMDTKEQKTLLEALKNLPRKKARDDVPQFRPDAPVNRPDDFSQNAFKKMDGTKATIPERREPQPRWQKTSQGI
jgi:hypothetical protein